MVTMINDRPPLDEIAKRAAQAGAGLVAAAKAVGLENHRQMLWSHGKRVDDDHEWAKQLRGQSTENTGGDEMGDIIVTGDIYGDAAVRSLERRKQVTQQTHPTPVEPQKQEPPQPAKKNNWILPLALAVALGCGVAIPLAIDALRSDPAPPTAETELPPFPSIPWFDIEKWEGPGTD